MWRFYMDIAARNAGALRCENSDQRKKCASRYPAGNRRAPCMSASHGTPATMRLQY
jgi:hypothetical protein